MSGAGADGVLILKVIALDKSEKYVPPTTFGTAGASNAEWWNDPYWGYYQPYPYHYWGYWYPAVQVVTSPGYWETHETFRVQAAIYRGSDNRLIWTATSETFDPTDQADLGASLAGPVIKNLQVDGLIQRR